MAITNYQQSACTIAPSKYVVGEATLPILVTTPTTEKINPSKDPIKASYNILQAVIAKSEAVPESATVKKKAEKKK